MDAVTEFDFSVLDALQKIHTPVLNVFLSIFSYMGEHGIFRIIPALVCCFIKR